MLEIVVTDHLYRRFPDYPEGRLAKLRAAVVSAPALAGVARDLELGELILLGKGELATGGRDKTSILADVTEAVIGALYLSGGMRAAADFVHHNIDSRIEAAAAEGALLDPKSELQELCAQRDLGAPTYSVSSEGPDHNKSFTAEVLVDDAVVGTGIAPAKRHAEQLAAAAAIEAMRA